jgi:Ca-activated chloride channel family protein
MSRLSEREIARKLAEREDFEPPAGLLEKIKSEIPPAVTVGAGVAGERRSVLPSRQRWLIAASLIAMVGAGLFALRPRQQAPSMESAVAARKSRPAAAAPKPESKLDALAESRPASPEPPPSSMQPSLKEELLRRDAPAAASSLPAPPPPPPPPSRRAAEKLKALGYIGESREQAVAAPAEIPEPQTEADAESGVVSGVEGGVEGGTVGGTPGGVASGALIDERRYDAPLRAGKPQSPAPGGRLRQEPASGYVDTFYKSAGINPFVDTAADRFSTFGLDVDTASYSVTRRYLTDGNLPDPKSVRVEEFVNSFDYGDPPPARGDFAIKAEGAPTPFTQGERHRLLRFNIRARQVNAEKRRPAVLTFVVDVSGSMNEENRLGLVKQSLSLLLDQLRPTDRVGLVIYGDKARLLLEPSNDREAVRRAIEQLQPQGSTNAEAGLLLGYQVADRNFRLNAANRIILCSDGVANVGHTGPHAILGQIGREARRGIELTTLGFGMGNYNDHLMEQLADRGDGRYAYIDTLDEARRVLVEELTGTLQTIAKNAKVQVEFNPKVVARYRLLGYENRDIADERFRDDAVDAGEIGAGHSVTALYEIELRPEAPAEGLIAALHLRYRTPEIGNTPETIRKLHVSELAASWEKASPGFRLAALVGQFAEILRQSPWAKGELNEVARQVRGTSGLLSKSAKAPELAELAAKAARIKAEQRKKE